MSERSLMPYGKNLGWFDHGEDVGSAQRLGRSRGSWMSRIFFWKKTIRSRSALHVGVKKTEPFPEDLSGLYKVQSYNKRQNSLFIFVKGSSSGARSGGSSVTLKIVFSWMWAPAAGNFRNSFYQTGHDAIAADSAPQRPVYLEKIAAVPYMNFDYGVMRSPTGGRQGAYGCFAACSGTRHRSGEIPRKIYRG